MKASRRSNSSSKNIIASPHRKLDPSTPVLRFSGHQIRTSAVFTGCVPRRLKLAFGIGNASGAKRYDELNVKGLSIADLMSVESSTRRCWTSWKNPGNFRFLTHGATPVVYRTTKVQAAMRPDGTPLYLDCKPVSG